MKNGYRLIHIWEDEWTNLTKNTLKDVFTGLEPIPNIADGFTLDLSWFKPIDNDLFLTTYLEPQIVIRNGYSVYDCGSLKYTKK